MKFSVNLLLSALIIISFYSCSDEPPVLPGLTKSGVTIITEPMNVSIKLNNKSYDSKSPLHIGDLEPGFYKVDLQLATYVDTVIYLMINRNVEDTFFVEMKEDPKLFWTVYKEGTSQLPTNNISVVYVDAQNIVWAGTRSKGLVKIDGNTWTIFTTSNSGLADNTINEIFVDSKNILWVATKNGLNSFNGTSWRTYNVNNSNIPDNNITAIYIDNQNNIWIGTDYGLSKFDRLKFINYNIDNSALISNHIKSIYADGNAVWIGTWGGGLNRIEGEKWNSYNTVRGELASNYISGIIKDKNGLMWFASGSSLNDGGIISYDGTTFTNYLSAGSTPLPIVTDVAMDSKGNLWFSSTFGLIKFNGSTWKVINSANSGLPNNSVVSVAVDKDDNKWLSASSLAKYIGGK